MRMAVGRSRRLVEKYAALYREFTATDDCIFRMARIHRMAEAHPPEKKGRKGRRYRDSRAEG